MRVVEIILSKETRDRDISPAEKKEVGLLKKKIDQYMDALSEPGTTPAQRASLHKKMTTAVAEVKKITEGRIDELFDGKSAEFTWGHQDASSCTALFTVNNQKFSFTASTGYDVNPNAWEVEFAALTDSVEPTAYQTGNYGITGKHDGSSVQVMSVVTKIIEEFLSTYNQVNQINFTADEPSRRRLYKRMITKLLPDWTVSDYNEFFTITSPELEPEKVQQKTEVEAPSEQINELFTGDKEWQWEDIGQNECSAVFTIQEQQYTFTAWTDENANSTWEVQFIADDAKRGQKFAVTGSGNAAEVMGTVTSIMKDFLAKYEVKGLIMSAKEASRQRLYKAMIHRLLPKWDVEADDGQLFITPPPENMMESEVPIEEVHYEVYDSQTGKKVGKVCTTRSGARRSVDRLDNAYGAYRYRYRPVPLTKPIMELMTGTTDYEVEEDTDGSFVASFWIGEVPYLYRALKNTRTEMWLIEFIDNSRSDSEMYKMTGSGNASQVMGTVLNLTREFLSQHTGVKGINFMAKEQSRDSLYKRIAAKLLPDWKMEQKGYIITLTKPGKPVMEAVHKVPLTEEDFEDIKTMMERPVPAALGLIYLQEVIVDDEFNDVLQSIQESDPNRDIRPLIAEWINRVMPDQLWRFGIGVQSDLERAGLFSPIHGYDPKEFYKQNQKSSSNKYGRT